VNATHLLARLLELAGDPGDGSYVLALAGEGLESVPASIAVRGTRYVVARPASELALRRLAWQANGAPFIAIIAPDLALRLPADLLRRARGERVHALEVGEVLSTVLGMQVVGVHDTGTQQLALEHIEALKAVVTAGDTHPTVIDTRLLDQLLTEIVLKRRLRGVTPGQLLAHMLRTGLAPDDRVAGLLKRHLPLRYANEGRILAWAVGDAQRLPALVVRGALLAIDVDDLPSSIWGPLQAALSDDRVGMPPDVLRPTVGRMAVDALEALGADAGPYLAQAEAVARDLLPPTVVAASVLLPSGLANRMAALARDIARGEAVAATDVQALKRHRAARDFRRDLDALTELARLSRYLAASAGPASSAILDHVTHYQQDGAFADLTVARLRRALAVTARFHPEAGAVLARWRLRRDADNEALARLLARDYEAAIHDPAVVPLHRVWAMEVLPALVGAPGVFVAVLDGCSYPMFLELVYELSHEPARAIGLGLGPDASRAVGRPGLAVLPSVTSHSRGALFLGDIPHDPWVDEGKWRGGAEAVTDPARFRQNAVLGGIERRLFLKAHLADGGVALREAIGDANVRIVVAVFNAIDDRIGSSATGTPLDVRLDQIAAFLPAVRAALDAGRKVLVVADHGHTPFESTALRVGAGPTPRFCELAPGETAPEGFVEIDLGGLGGAKARQAFAWRMSAYRGQPQAGFHGGCSLEEMVVPMGWLVPDGLPADEPGWWFGGTS
jgi:hypothetical protein